MIRWQLRIIRSVCGFSRLYSLYSLRSNSDETVLGGDSCCNVSAARHVRPLCISERIFNGWLLAECVVRSNSWSSTGNSGRYHVRMIGLPHDSRNEHVASNTSQVTWILLPPCCSPRSYPTALRRNNGLQLHFLQHRRSGLRVRVWVPS